ncbi:imidazolonepropionase-like amidohydrolase [Sphingomonas zeicaulis]|uniref:amidohydrolase family protein n=1 Tax=Sphingomonas zeicaulis TaxID=1632740 RepID=UPI003D1C25EE
MKKMRQWTILVLACGAATGAAAQSTSTLPARAEAGRPTTIPALDRKPGDGEGPFGRLAIRGVTFIDGTGAPPRGPVDILIEGNRIVDIVPAGAGGTGGFDHEIDATGQFVLPGFIDAHAHGGGTEKVPDLGYVYKLWLAHGVTTVRTVPLTGNAIAVSEKQRSAANRIAAPRIFNYQVIGSGWDGGRVDTPEGARAWVRWAARNGIDGIKFFNRGGETPAGDTAAIDEARKLGLGTVAHLSQPNVAEFDADAAGAAGLGTITHFYGHFESLLADRTIQPFPADYNYEDEQQRFAEVANLRLHTVQPGAPEWQAYLERQKARGVTFDPTLNIYSASRDVMRARTAEWHRLYTAPTLWKFFQSSRSNHGSYFFDWTTENEVAWKNFYRLYGRLIDDYRRIGGRVTVGTDAGFIYKLFGFSYIEELEFLREVGFAPLEVIRAATRDGAATLWEPGGQPAPVGIVRRGMLADLIITPENPLANLKTLYGTGHIRLDTATDKPVRVGGIRYTIKDGIIYDARALLRDVADQVAAEKRRLGQGDELPTP